MNWRLVLGLCVLASSGSLYAAGAVWGARIVEQRLRPLNVWVDGWVLTPGANEGALVEQLARRTAERRAFLKDGGELYGISFGELGIELDRSALLERLRAARPDNGWRARWSRIWRAPGPEPEVRTRLACDEERAARVITSYASVLARAPVNARLDLAAHRRIEDQPGRELDVPATLNELRQRAFDGTPVFDARFHELPARVRSESLPPVDVSRVLASFETDFSKKPMSRRPNIEAAARYLEGFVLQPGAVLSFNKVVGPRTFERGFREAPVIVADELESDLGGGVCQVATAVFAASALGGLEILERRSHSRPSGYAPLGLDAAVVYGKVDLRVRNPYPVPVLLHTSFPTPKSLRVELLGLQAPQQVEHSFRVRERKPYHRKVVIKTDVPPDAIEQKQKGNAGYEVVSTLRSVASDGSVRRREYPSRYYPVPEVFWIGTAVDPNSLPALAEDETHVEIERAPQAL
ncbi:MAG TPA: VanW family protein [Polyangiaceae bacterium]|nr:VanW family protein [Polyangiaceae bacterium]